MTAPLVPRAFRGLWQATCDTGNQGPMGGLETKRPQSQWKEEHWPSIAQSIGTFLLSAFFSMNRTSQLDR